jgi:hypothetical protein
VKNQRKNQKNKIQSKTNQKKKKKNQKIKPTVARPIRKKSKNKVVGAMSLDGQLDLGRPNPGRSWVCTMGLHGISSSWCFHPRLATSSTNPQRFFFLLPAVGLHLSSSFSSFSHFSLLSLFLPHIIKWFGFILVMCFMLRWQMMNGWHKRCFLCNLSI